MNRHVGATGSQPTAVQAAHEFLLDEGSAVGAVLAGFFADAGMRAGVLLGPLIVIIAGVGTGVRVFDGRLRQPGLGAKRPRGFTNPAAIPLAARVAAPHAIAAAVVAHAYDRSGSFAEVVKRGVRIARETGADARAQVLVGVQSQGARFLSSPQASRSLMHVAGVSEEGLLTQADLTAVADLDMMARPHPALPGWSEVPWADADERNLAQEPSETSASLDSNEAALLRQSTYDAAGATMILCAVDARGVFAGAAYQCAHDGVAFEELGLVAPMSAVPVLRGVPRLASGTCLPAPAALAIQADRGVPTCIVGDSSANHITQKIIVNSPEFRIQRPLESRLVTVTERGH
jgi:hypothetical protein